MSRPRLIRNWIFVSAVLLCQFTYGQNSTTQNVPIAADSGIVTVKSRWYRHVVMMASPMMSAPQGTAMMGLPSGGGFGGSRRGFMYEATLKNESGREVKAIHWDHVFLDPKNGKEMRRFHFYNDWHSIGKGKTATLSRMTGSPPSGVIDVARLEKGNGPQYVERIDVKCVLYKGDLFWQAAGATVSECAAIRRKLQKKRSK